MSAKQIQYDWQVCSRCGGLFYTGRGHTPTCKAGDGKHPHTTEGNTNRGVQHVPNTNTDNFPDWEESNWRFCENCYGLFRVYDYATSFDHGMCNHAKTGSAHVAETNSAFYVLEAKVGEPSAAEAAGTYYECSKCGGLFHDWTVTACNAGGQHEKFIYAASVKYFLLKAK
jgi:hypothetical protein